MNLNLINIPRDALSADLTGSPDPKRLLQQWASEGGGDDGLVWLCRKGGVEAYLDLKAKITDAANWDGDMFNCGDSVSVSVQANNAEAAAAAVGGNLFRFGGYEACFPLDMSPVMTARHDDKTVVAQTDPNGFTAAPYVLSLKLPREFLADPDNWK